MTKTEQFFFDHAGWGYDPLTETSDEGRARCAKRLAAAEQWATDEGMSFEWTPDEYADEPGEWCCVARDAGGVVLASLGGVGFESGEPWGDPYRRVVEAELALEARGA